MADYEDYDINAELEKNKAHLTARWRGHGETESLSIMILGTHPQAVRDLAEAMFKINSKGIGHWDCSQESGELLKGIEPV